MTDQKIVKQDLGPLKIAFIYLSIGCLWILFSDKIVAAIALDRELLILLSIAKGWGYVIVTALLLYWLIRRYTVSLRESDEKWQSLVSATPDFIALHDQEGRFLYLNHYAEGLSEKDVLGRYAHEYVSPESREMFVRKMEESLKTWTTQKFEHGALGDHGALKTYEQYLIPMMDEDKEINILSIARDITERKQAEQALNDSQARLASIIHSAMDAIISIDHSNRIVLFNPAAEKMFGYASGEIMGQSLDILIPEIYRTEHYRQIEKFGRTGITNRHMNGYKEITGLRKNGDEFPIDTSISQIEIGEKKLFTAILRDATERKRTEETLQKMHDELEFQFQQRTLALSQTTSLLETMLEYVPDQIYFKDAESRFIKNSRSQARALGLSDPSLVVGRTDFDFFPHAQRSFDEEQEIIRSGKPLVDFEEWVVWPDGKETWVSTTKAPLRDHEGKIIGTFGISRDITDRKRTEESLRKAKDELEVGVAERTAELRDANELLQLELSERKQMEASLRESEELYHRLFENMLNGFAYCKMLFDQDQPQDFIYLDVNSAFESLTGLKNVIGKKVSEVIPGIKKSDPGLFEIYGRVSLTGMPEKFETYLKALKMWFSISVYSPQKEYFVAVFDVITERKQAEETLKDSEIRYRRLFEAAKDGILILDADSGGIIDVNPFLIKLLGYSHEVFLGGTIWELGFFKDIAASKENFLELQQKEYIRYEDLPLETADGKRINVEFVSNVYQVDHHKIIQCNIRDITDRKQAEQAIHESEERLRLSMQAANQGLYDLNVQTGATIVNREYAQMLGYDPETFVETNSAWIERLHPDDREITAKAYTDYINGLTPEYRVEFRQKTGDDHWKWILSLGKVVEYDGEGKPLRMLGTHTDITERKEAEKEIQHLNETLEQRIAERTAQLEAANRELEAFSYSVSHDLRSPLRGIDGWSLALLEDYGPMLDEQGQAHIQRVRTETQRMGMLIEDILKLSRITRAEMNKEKVDLSVIAEAEAARLQETKPQDRQVEFVIQKGLTAMGDPKLLDVVLTNLLENAFKFTSKKQEAHIEFGQTIVEGEHAFFVRDNGAGFDMAYAKNLFGAFQRMHRASEFPGTGIGLATVLRVIQRHGGSIWASSEVGQGATFYFTLEDKQ